MQTTERLGQATAEVCQKSSTVLSASGPSPCHSTKGCTVLRPGTSPAKDSLILLDEGRTSNVCRTFALSLLQSALPELSLACLTSKLVVSYNRTAALSDAIARVLPSGEKDNDFTMLVCPSGSSREFKSLGVPQSHCPVPGPRCQDVFA